MRIDALGDAAYVLRELSGPPHELAARLNAEPIPGLIEAVASYDTVGVYVEPSVFDIDRLLGVPSSSKMEMPSKKHMIPVCYELGDDFDEAASRLGLPNESLISLHSAGTYQCFAIGFCPGFPYLGYLDDAISGLPRRASPRVRIEPGSVAITGRQTGIYPLPRPGGWWLIGRTPLTLVDVADDYFPISAGDQVRFVPISTEEYEERRGQRL